MTFGDNLGTRGIDVSNIPVSIDMKASNIIGGAGASHTMIIS